MTKVLCHNQCILNNNSSTFTYCQTLLTSNSILKFYQHRHPSSLNQEICLVESTMENQQPRYKKKKKKRSFVGRLQSELIETLSFMELVWKVQSCQAKIAVSSTPSCLHNANCNIVIPANRILRDIRASYPSLIYCSFFNRHTQKSS